MSVRIALFGQAPLAVECLDRLLADGHELVAVYAPPDRGRPDAFAARAEALELPLFRRRYFQRKTGEPIGAALAEYLGLGAELNVMASMTSFLPGEIRDAPVHKSLCFHPSLLPAYRGGNAMQWQIIEGAEESGVTIFEPDAGVDSGPIVVQKGGVGIGPDDTTGTLFFRKLCPLGVDALVEAVRLVDAGDTKPELQDESAASFHGLVDDAVAAIDLGQPAAVVDRLVRGCDPQPGAFVRADGALVRLFDARLESAGTAEPGTLCALDERGLGLGLAMPRGSSTTSVQTP